MKHRFSVIVAGALLTACASWAQQSTPLMSLNVVAVDGRGQPVTDLTSADFEVSDGGKNQPIAFFRPAPAPAVQQRKSPGTNEYSNRGGAAMTHATLMIFDLLNGDTADRGVTWNEIARALEARESSDFLYLYLLTREGKLYPVHPLPESPADIHPADVPWTKQVKSQLDQAMKAVNRLRLGGIVEDDRVRMTYKALDQVVSGLQMLPGRKNIVWVSRGVPITIRLETGADQIDYEPLLHKLSDHCLLAKVSIYSVNQSSSATPSAGELASVDTLTQIANLTGGRMYPTNDAAGRAVDLAMEEWRASYTVAYRPGDENWDGKSHKIRVTCTRRGVNLQFPQSYNAERPVATDRMRNALQSAVTSPFDYPEIGMRVAVSPGAQPATAHFLAHVDPADVMLTDRGERSVTQLVVVFVDFTAKGPKAVSQPAALDIGMTKAQQEAAAKDGIPVSQDRPVGQDITRIRLIMYDPATNLLGSATVPVSK